MKLYTAGVLEKIYDSAIKFIAPQTLPETYKTALEEALKLTHAREGALFLEQQGILSRVYSSIRMTSSIEPRSDGYTYKSFKTGKTIILKRKDMIQVHPKVIKSGIKSAVIVPLSHHKKTIGVMTLRSTNEDHFTKSRIETIKLFGSLVTLAIQKNQLYFETHNALKTRDLFISMAAHELRTPTTTIQGYVQLMKRKYERGDKLPSKWFDVLYAETVRLNNLLRELLQIEQVKTGQLAYKLKKSSLREIMDRVKSYVEVTHKHHKFIFKDSLGKKSDSLHCDFDKILQVLITLINNSVKFSQNGTKITIEFEADTNFYRIRVSDEGHGISKRDLPHIFEGFYKGKDNTKAGMGLGLYLAENIVTRHGGFMNAASEINKGTTIEIKLPIYNT